MPDNGGYNERFTGTLRREVLNAEWFATARQAQIVINCLLRQYNFTRPHQAFNMCPPVTEKLRKVIQSLGARQGCTLSLWAALTP
ncbi:transposase [Sulfitobacter sp. JBTF-M27]|uniref:Transposase n=1 Tax=Sulfitobacter sediminilitoris TaxID=2698830 RepID=A0A6P0CIF0_9RHOB|nr:transposase [Sulfitobacter sediminilitoris]